MFRRNLIEDTDNMEYILCALASNSDIWQNKFIYWIAKALWDICQVELKRIEKEKHNE